MTEIREDKNFHRAMLRRIKREPMTVEQLAEASGYKLKFVRAKLQRYCELGICKGRIVGETAKGKPIIAYGVNHDYNPDDHKVVACDDAMAA